MVQGFAPHLGSLDIDVEVGYYFFLAGEVFKFLRADYSVQILIFVDVCIVRIEFCHQGSF